MNAAAVMLLVGTIGFFVLVAYGTFWLRRFPHCIRVLAVVLLTAHLFWGCMRLLLQAELLTPQDMLIINGTAPWIAFVWLSSYKHPRRAVA